MASRLEHHLALPREDKESRAEDIFPALARFTARALLAKYTG
jgi:hypothetical protein